MRLIYTDGFATLTTLLLVVACTDHSTMVDVEIDSSSSAVTALSSSITSSSSLAVKSSSSELTHSSSSSLDANKSSGSQNASSAVVTVSSSSEAASSSGTKISSSSFPMSSSSFVALSSESQSSSSKAVWAYLNQAISYGEITDVRDGQVYKTVVIGTQTWMAENLNYAVDSSWCFNNSADSCAKYGRLYQWAATMNIDPAYNESIWGGSDVNHQGICPSDWHISNYDEWQTLYDYVAANNGSEGVGTSLKSTSGWTSNGNGSDLFGFSALPAGNRHNDGSFYYAGYGAYFWSATESSSDYANYWNLNYNGGDFDNVSNNFKNDGFSIRCLKN